jgi:nuclear transport factor 2 (NTF2) superfamily protein
MWEFDDEGLMTHRYASIDDAPIRADERRLLASDRSAAPSGGR